MNEAAPCDIISTGTLREDAREGVNKVDIRTNVIVTRGIHSPR